MEEGATRYAVTWKKGPTWKRHKRKVHMGFDQEAYDEECADIARALETAARRCKSLPISPSSQTLRLPSRR